MTRPDPSLQGNRLVANMQLADFERLWPLLEKVELPTRFALSVPGQIADYCYFLQSGIGSIVLALNDGGKRAEIGLFGNEGMTPAAIVLNAPSSPCSVFMQVGGDGFRIQSTLLTTAMAESVTLRNLLTRYAQTVALQTGFTAVVNATQTIEQRLARWILMCHDRVSGDTISLTHEFLSVMLAVRRQSVTTTLPVLEGALLIKAEHRHVTVLDRAGLRKFAGTAYGGPELEYKRLMGFESRSDNEARGSD